MQETERSLTEEEIQRVYEMLDMATEDEREKIKNRLSFAQEIKKSPVRIKGDNVTTPYPGKNA